ncbi:hypothetical protein UlMin_012927 [Ulmus minor]
MIVIKINVIKSNINDEDDIDKHFMCHVCLIPYPKNFKSYLILQKISKICHFSYSNYYHIPLYPILTIPFNDWRDWGGIFEKLFGEGASKSKPEIECIFRLYFEGETNKKYLEALLKNTGKESLQWGLAAGVYSGLTYGLNEASITGVALALASDDSSQEQVVQCAITGAAISTAAYLLTGIF